MAFRLEGTAGTWILPIGDTVIGRGEDCGVRLADPRLSRHHARLEVKPAQVMVHDLGSANGVLVNGDRIAASAVLLPGDEVVCGPLRLCLLNDDDRSPSGVRSQPVTETLRGLIGASQSAHSNRSHTEQMDGEVVAREVALSRQLAQTPGGKPASKLNPAIAAAVSAVGVAPSGRRAGSGSTAIRPSEMMEAVGSTSALSPNRFHEPSAPLSPHGTSHLLPSEAPSHTSAALEVGRTPSPNLKPNLPHTRSLRGARLLAGIGDPLWILLFALIVGVAVAVIGVTSALAMAGAGIVNDEVALPGAPRAAIGELVSYLMTPVTWGRVDALARQLHGCSAPWPFVVFFLALALGAVVAEILLLWGLVAATVHRGGPWLHRRLGLHLAVRRNGHHPGWLRGMVRWILLALTWPAAFVTATIGVRGIHDWLTGCEIRRKS